MSFPKLGQHGEASTLHAISTCTRTKAAEFKSSAQKMFSGDARVVAREYRFRVFERVNRQIPLQSSILYTNKTWKLSRAERMPVLMGGQVGYRAIGCQRERGRPVKVVFLCLTLGRGGPDESLPTPRSAKKELGCHRYDVRSPWWRSKSIQGNVTNGSVWGRDFNRKSGQNGTDG
jgi:hypothetical protein